MKKLLGTALGTAGVIAVLTALARAAGFVRAWVQNGALGATAAGEAYSTANTVPNVLFEIAAGGALAAAVIPLISGFLAKHLAEDVSRTASALFTWVIALGVPLAAAVSLGAYPIVSFLLGAGTDPGEVAFGASLLRMFSWQIPLYGISVVCTGVLQAHKKFVLPALAPLLNSVVVIGIFVLFAHVGGGHQNVPARISQLALYILGWGTTAGVAAFSLPQLIPVMRRVRLRPTFRFPAGVDSDRGHYALCQLPGRYRNVSRLHIRKPALYGALCRPRCSHRDGGVPAALRGCSPPGPAGTGQAHRPIH